MISHSNNLYRIWFECRTNTLRDRIDLKIWVLISINIMLEKLIFRCSNEVTKKTDLTTGLTQIPQIFEI
jgi:hypothetical protein